MRLKLAVVSNLARYGGTTLESYRADLRQFFQWCHDHDVATLAATRTHIELYRAWMDARGLAASTMHAALAVLLGLNGLRVGEACGANIEDLGFERGQRTLQIVGEGNKPPGIPLVPRTARTLDLAIGERSDGPILLRHDGIRLDTRTAYRWVRSVGKQAGLERIHPHMLRAAFIMAALDAGVSLRDVQVAARHADPRTTTVYDRRRQNYDRHAAYAVVAFVTNG